MDLLEESFCRQARLENRVEACGNLNVTRPRPGSLYLNVRRPAGPENQGGANKTTTHKTATEVAAIASNRNNTRMQQAKLGLLGRARFRLSPLRCYLLLVCLPFFDFLGQ